MVVFMAGSTLSSAVIFPPCTEAYPAPPLASVAGPSYALHDSQPCSSTGASGVQPMCGQPSNDSSIGFSWTPTHPTPRRLFDAVVSPLRPVASSPAVTRAPFFSSPPTSLFRRVDICGSPRFTPPPSYTHRYWWDPRFFYPSV